MMTNLGFDYKMLSQFDRQFLKRQIKILPPEYTKWQRQQLTRLLALLKIPQVIQKQFLQLSSDVTQKSMVSIPSITSSIQPSITQHSYFPFQKLKSALSIISTLQDDTSQLSVLNKNGNQRNQEIYIKQQNVLLLKQNIHKLEDSYVIEMSVQQIYALLRNSQLQSQAALLKKYAIDGFGLVCLLCDSDIVKDIRNYFKDEQIRVFLQMSCLFMTHYFRQQIMQKVKKSQTPQVKKISSTTTVQSQKQYIIEASELSKKYSQDDIDLDDENQMGKSVMGNSQFATSEIGQSVMDGDIRESVIMDSVYAQSQFADSVRGSVDCRMSFRVAQNNGRASMMYNSEILNQLKEVCLNLPFDLLNLEPLQQIKFRSLKTPFGKEVDKDCWIFSVKGAKLGRDKQNDLRFPDELSISGKHAQVLFKSDGFYLQDLGSKTGTYLKIQKNHQIQDQIYVQFSTEIQILFKIIKKTSTQGTIKAEIKKPQNMNDYKITIKQKNKIKIGRSERCHIRINNQLLGDKHSEVFYRDGEFYFKNCHSTCLSWLRLSAKSVISPHFKLNAGDIFRLSSKKSFYVQEIYSYFDK